MGKCCSKGVTLSSDTHEFEYDLIVIGGGSGGMAAAKQAGKDKKRVLLVDFVTPTPMGNTWGLGGTCTNVGCVPKKLFHAAAQIAETLSDAQAYGFEMGSAIKKLTPFRMGVEHTWTKLVDEVQSYIHKQNWDYRLKLSSSDVKYMNAFAEFVDPHTLELRTSEGDKTTTVTGNIILVAIGGRPRYLKVPGGKKHEAICITSDDLFSLPYPPGKTLIVGASYVALECAGFLIGLGFDVTVMARTSVLLRGFDQEMANKIGDHLQALGVRIITDCEPLEIKKIEDGTPARIQVRAGKADSPPNHEEVYNTVILAIGREPSTKALRIEHAAKVELGPTGKILVNPQDQSSVPSIYAVGDVAEGRPELATIAIHSGKLLAQRLFSTNPRITTLTNYTDVPTTVFTPLEYGCIGISEEDARSNYDFSKLAVYQGNFQPLEFVVPGKFPSTCFLKLICRKPKEEVIGLHYLGPSAGEVVQGFALAFKLKATKADYDGIIGIHPTCAERFTTLNNLKGTGTAIEAESC